MTLVQLEYVVAVDTYRHFATAAEKNFVTQPTLSMQIQKLEDELGVKIFDRSKQPVVPTEVGEAIIQQARLVLSQSQVIQEIIRDKKGELAGELRLGVIPTLAPYLLPLFLKSFLQKYPKVKLRVTEMTTENMATDLKKNKLDAGLLVTPLQDNSLKEQVLFYEELLAYVSHSNALYEKKYVLPNDIDLEKLWLLEEGHCFRSQILNLCELRKALPDGKTFEYEAGSIETLRRMVEQDNGITIIPELATLDLSVPQQKLVRHFNAPAPVREVSLVTHRDYVKKRLIEVLKTEILAALPDKVKQNKNERVITI
ncbi:LysR family transcriptional regulator [Adhaeribacter swui]|uniref:LysR family transcriptional regulator n=1 Tax=Adhaeribacter swui TaxID=2086471 RepID=A0A7G7G4W9_9BACT|nr:hydrogen peroxide-inducible genes activator [Adhaeribacter swui]QNF32203.1 LysR family transcriptional regulator [Adhaeribacter swui]